MAIRPLLTDFSIDNLNVSFVMSTNGDDPAGVQREKQDVKPRMSQMRLGNASLPSQRQPSRVPSQASTRHDVPPSRAASAASSSARAGPSGQQPLFRPRDTTSPEASNRRPIKIDDDEDDNSLWAEMDAADPSFSQIAIGVEDGRENSLEHPDETLEPTRITDDQSEAAGVSNTDTASQPIKTQQEQGPLQGRAQGIAGHQDVIDMSLEDDTEDSLMPGGQSRSKAKRPRRVSTR